MKIVGSRSLLASDTRFLNDTKELTHLTTTITDRLKTRLRRADADTKPALKWLLNHLENDEHDPVYVISLSENADDLSQWRGYTPPSQGVCIGFDTQALREALDLAKGDRHDRARFLMLGRMIYLGENEGSSFDEFITSACNYIDVINGEVVRSVAAERLLVSARPFYKHIAFKNEREWRIRMSANSVFIHDPLPVVCRLGKSFLVPATYLSFTGTSMENSFIKEIIVGPTPEKELSAYSMRAFIESENLHGVAVRSSQIPYRNW
ncbi:DUF2971 domain-containing protein [Granulicella sp. dw_53]|uniref:DUF2971 domain-containing protein n=1 Tax=Granulicella sp. dw_53 TaxID=2719792 RepID=UPI001BD36E2C|nr:DUF2971 domain-containing protein [Granulicella sp. dw_53]